MLSSLISILYPFVYGIVIAYLLKPSVNFFADLFERKFPKGLHRLISPLSITLSLVFAGIFIYALFALILPEFIDSVTIAMVTLPTATKDLLTWLQKVFEDEPLILEYINTGYNAISSFIEDWFTSSVVPQITTILSGFGLGVVNIIVVVKNLFIGLFAAIYLLASRKKFARQGNLLLHSICPKKWADIILSEIAHADRMFSGFINGKILDSIIIGFLCYFVCLIVGFPNPTLVSIIIGVTNVIPFFGPFIGAVPATLLILMVEPIKAIWFVMFVLILQQLDGNIIGPKILGDSTGLASFWVLFSIILFGGLWGFPGMIVGVPLFAILYNIVRQLIEYGLKRNNCSRLLVQYNKDFGAQEHEPSLSISKLTNMAKSTHTNPSAAENSIPVTESPIEATETTDATEANIPTSEDTGKSNQN